MTGESLPIGKQAGDKLIGATINTNGTLRAQATAVKLIFPLVLFIFPGIFTVLVGPAAISLYRDMITE